jgi:putative SOS response-associated peptidase YedK
MGLVGSVAVFLGVCHTLPMCGRYRLSRRKQIIEDHFATDPDEVVWAPRYNIAPTQFVAVIRQNPEGDRREPASELHAPLIQASTWTACREGRAHHTY